LRSEKKICMNEPIGDGVRNRWPVLFGLFQKFRSDNGAALVELALLISFLLMPLLLAIVDMGTLVYASIEISNSGYAGAMVGMENSAQAQNNAEMTTAAQAEASDFAAANVKVTPSAYYACNTTQNGTQYATESAGNAGCISPSYPLEFVQVVVNVPVNIPFHCWGIPATMTLHGQSVIQVLGQQ